MEKIFHEKQEGSLCAQHCLNSLLQGAYFDAVSLSSIARELDEAERQTMAMGGNVNSPEYLAFLQQPSSNYDDSGYFSIQVICKALELWGLQMMQFNSQAAAETRQNPLAENAYICNQSNHWLTIRKFGKQWFNLNSVKMCPELVSDTYLSLLLAQLQQEGYSIFVIKGKLPDCEANLYLQHHNVTQAEFRAFEDTFRKKPANKKTEKQVEEVDTTPAKPVDVEDVRNKRLNFFLNKQQQPDKDTSTPPSGTVSVSDNLPSENPGSAKKPTEDNELTEEEMMKIAMQMSMENV